MDTSSVSRLLVRLLSFSRRLFLHSLNPPLPPPPHAPISSLLLPSFLSLSSHSPPFLRDVRPLSHPSPGTPGDSVILEVSIDGGASFTTDHCQFTYDLFKTDPCAQWDESCATCISQYASLFLLFFVSLSSLVALCAPPLPPSSPQSLLWLVQSERHPSRWLQRLAVRGI